MKYFYPVGYICQLSTVFIVAKKGMEGKFVRIRRLELLRLSAPDPKSGAATNYAISAGKRGAKIITLQLLQGIFIKIMFLPLRQPDAR